MKTTNKVKENKMKYQTHNDKQIEIGETWLQGYCPPSTTYEDLVKLFGKPTTVDGYKTDAEWIIEFEDGTIATIYNYKTGKNYCGDEGLEVEDMSGNDWHIGGSNSKSVDRINDKL